MKRLIIALAGISLTAFCNAFAAYPGNTDPTLIAIPQLPGGYVLGLTGIYMQPSASNGDTDWSSLITATSTTITTTTQQIDPGWSFGVGANIGYFFPNTGNDINLSYLHLNTNDNDSVTATGFNPNTGAQVVAPVNAIGAFPYQTGSSITRYSLDQADLTFGQFVNIGCRLVLHPFAGARFASISRDLDSNYSVNSATTTIAFAGTESVSESSDFTGIGPLAGVDVSYYIWNGIGAVGHFDSALLIGNNSSSVDEAFNGSTTVIATGLTVPISLDDNSNTAYIRRIVPVVDVALGLDYTWLFNNESNSDLTFEVGYKVSNYFNAIDRIYESTNTVSSSDLGISGVYATLTLHA